MRFGFGFMGFGWSSSNGLRNPASALPSFASWPALVGAEMNTDPGFTNAAAWTLDTGVTVNVLPGKLVFTAAADGAAAFQSPYALIGEASYRTVAVIGTATLGGVRPVIGGEGFGTTRTAAGTFQQDITAGFDDGYNFLIQAVGTTTATLDSFSFKSIGLMGVEGDWTLPVDSITWDAAAQGLKFEDADNTKIVSITGTGLTQFTAAVSFNTAVMFSVYVSGFVGGGDASVRIHNGSWVPLNFLADGWSTPVAVTTGAVAGLDFRGNAGGTSTFIIQACDIDLAP